MNFFDIIFLIILLYFSIKGFIHGMVKEFVSTIAFFVSIYVAMLYFHKTELYVKLFISEYSPYFKIVVFVITFILAFLIIKIIEWFVSKIIDKTGLSFLNKLMGFMLGFVKGTILITILFHFFVKLDNKCNLLNPEVKEKSVFYKHIEKYTNIIFPFLKAKVTDGIYSK
ncbi:MAG: CvpA family protein [Bacteroidales bacterium]|nr:CvpA family protein [Bacteroidales bacterium]